MTRRGLSILLTLALVLALALSAGAAGTPTVRIETPETVKAYDLVIITTAHSKVDYEMVCGCGVPVFDCKNVTKHIQNRENIEVL